MVEKPLARFLRDTQQMCKLAEEKRLVLMTAFCKRYSPPYGIAKKFVEEGTIGEPAMIVAKMCQGWSGSKLFENQSSHLFDLMRYFMGDIKSIFARGVNKYGEPNYPIGNAVINFEFTSGSIGSFVTNSSGLSLKPWERIEIYGNHKWFAIEDQYELWIYDSEEDPAKNWKPVVPNTLLFDEDFGGYLGEIQNFIEVVRGGQKPTATGWDGHKALEIATAVHISLKTKSPVMLPLSA